MTTRTVARRLGLRRRVVRASLVHAKNCMAPRLEMVPAVSGETAHRHAVWRYRAQSSAPAAAAAAAAAAAGASIF
jgi:hypothetical protein